LQIDAALKLGIARMYLGFARKKFTEKVYFDYVNASNPTMLSLQGWFKMIDPSTMEMYPEWIGIETGNSFADYCKFVGEGDLDYWRKIYERIGLEYNAQSPASNLLPKIFSLCK
jgi:hypothetical protein